MGMEEIDRDVYSQNAPGAQIRAVHQIYCLNCRLLRTSMCYEYIYSPAFDSFLCGMLSRSFPINHNNIIRRRLRMHLDSQHHNC